MSRIATVEVHTWRFGRVDRLPEPQVPCLLRLFAHYCKCLPLEIGLADRMLCNELNHAARVPSAPTKSWSGQPCAAMVSLSREAFLRWTASIRGAYFWPSSPVLQKLLAHPKVFCSHRDQFFSQKVVQLFSGVVDEPWQAIRADMGRSLLRPYAELKAKHGVDARVAWWAGSGVVGNYRSERGLGLAWLRGCRLCRRSRGRLLRRWRLGLRSRLLRGGLLHGG